MPKKKMKLAKKNDTPASVRINLLGGVLNELD